MTLPAAAAAAAAGLPPPARRPATRLLLGPRCPLWPPTGALKRGAVSTGCAPRPIRGARGMGGERLALPQRGGQSLRATPRPFAWRGGCGARGARGRRRRGGGTFSAALRLSARPAPVPGNPPRTRAGRGGAAPAGASRCAGSGQSWGWRGFCRSIQLAPVTLNLRYPGTRGRPLPSTLRVRRPTGKDGSLLVPTA